MSLWVLPCGSFSGALYDAPPRPLNGRKIYRGVGGTMTITGLLLRSLIDGTILENPDYGQLENTVEREILITPREPRHAKGVLNVWV